MSTAVAVLELQPNPGLHGDEAAWEIQGVEELPERQKSTLFIVAKWVSIVGLLAAAGLRVRVAPVEFVFRFLVDAGAIVMMARALIAGRYAVAVVAAALVVLFNPLAPVFELSGAWQRAALVAMAIPFLVLLICRDIRTARNV